MTLSTEEHRSQLIKAVLLAGGFAAFGDTLLHLAFAGFAYDDHPSRIASESVVFANVVAEPACFLMLLSKMRVFGVYGLVAVAILTYAFWVTVLRTDGLLSPLYSLIVPFAVLPILAAMAALLARKMEAR